MEMAPVRSHLSYDCVMTFNTVPTDLSTMMPSKEQPPELDDIYKIYLQFHTDFDLSSS
jgi:hypothetical protein